MAAKRYLVRTPENPEYKGKAAGVEFSKGKAVVEELTLDTSLGRSVEDTVKILKNDLGYQVEEIKDK